MAGRVRMGGWAYVWTNFKNSITRRTDTRIKVGDDYLGNKYFEQQIKSNEQNRQRIVRSFQSRTEDTWENVPPEWEAWLRNKRPDPPSREEIHANLQMMKQKQENAKKLEAKRLQELASGDNGSVPTDVDPAATVPYPKYEEFSDETFNSHAKSGSKVRDHTIR